MAIRALPNHRPQRSLSMAVTVLLVALTAACATPQKPTPVPILMPVRVPPPRPAPRPAPPPPADWRDAPQSPGDWRWSALSGSSQASFGLAGVSPLVMLTCDLPSRTVLLARASVSSDAPGAVPMTVRTTFNLRPLTSDPAASRPGWITARLAARDPLLDAMAFSRGRFTLEVTGLATLYVPSWPELSRVIEDCR